MLIKYQKNLRIFLEEIKYIKHDSCYDRVEAFSKNATIFIYGISSKQWEEISDELFQTEKFDFSNYGNTSRIT